MTAQSVSVHHDRDDPSKKAAFEPVKLQLWLAIAAYPPGRLYRAVSPDEISTPPSGALWLHEIKHDGFRVIARKDGARVRLYSRPGNDVTWP
jgi:hypothetical protein